MNSGRDYDLKIPYKFIPPVAIHPAVHEAEERRWQYVEMELPYPCDVIDQLRHAH
jgi:hypothetical protein